MAPEPKRFVAASHFSPDVQEFIKILHKHKVAYVLVGGQAVIYHGHARFTGDVDFFYLNDPENSERLFHGLQEFWGGEIPGVNSAEELREWSSSLEGRRTGLT